MRHPFFDGELNFTASVPVTGPQTALLVIDMQYHDASPDQGMNLAVERLAPGSLDYFNKRVEASVIPEIAALLAVFRSRAMPVVYLTVGSHDRQLRDMPSRIRAFVRDMEERSGVADVFWSGNPAFAIRSEIAPLPSELVINKTTWGAFTSSPIDALLRDRGIRNLVIAGVSSSACVETTARQAGDLGYACALVDAAMADYDEESHMAVLRAFHFNYGRVVLDAAELESVIDGDGVIA
ncbi:MAG: cysteine hydrolase [Actinobacteria bacterium]|nr:cysteine hydrolase [Actinomycetota bacterium]